MCRSQHIFSKTVNILTATYYRQYYRGMDDQNYVTIQEAAANIGVTETAIRNATLDGRLPFIRKYGRKLIANDDLEAYRRRTQPLGVKTVGRPKQEPLGAMENENG